MTLPNIQYVLNYSAARSSSHRLRKTILFTALLQAVWCKEAARFWFMTTGAIKVDSQASSRGRSASRETMCTDSPTTTGVAVRLCVTQAYPSLSTRKGPGCPCKRPDWHDHHLSNTSGSGFSYSLCTPTPDPPPPNLDLASELVFFSFFFLTTRTGQILCLGRWIKLFGSSCTSPSADPARLSLFPAADDQETACLHRSNCRQQTIQRQRILKERFGIWGNIMDCLCNCDPISVIPLKTKTSKSLNLLKIQAKIPKFHTYFSHI